MGVPLGVLPDFPYSTTTVTLAPGELLALFSDGIPEAQRGEEFFDDRRLHEALLADGAMRDLRALRGGVLARVDAFLAGVPRTDDITLVLIRREAAGARP
jgi:sigma-B regulation protein RsbU (phosphoserine phosphatase)